MDAKDLSFKDLIDKINKDLGRKFCDRFRYARKELSNSGRASSSDILFKFVDDDRDWVINEGGGVEVQYHLFYRKDTIGYGLGFNAQYVPFANKKSPVEYIKPFVNAFLKLKKENDSSINQLESRGFSIINGNGWGGLRKIKLNDYYLFGKEIVIENGILDDEEYHSMLEDIKTDLYDLYVRIWKQMKEMEKNSEMIQETINLLENNHNLILTGAPGTGKTYMAKQVAAKMLKTDDLQSLKGNSHFGFVQFHPSYDYTDFIEGLRPICQDDKGHIGFERRAGVFKEFCKNAALDAMQVSSANPMQVFNKLYEILLQKIKEGEIDQFIQRTGKPIFIKEVSSNNNLILIVSTEQDTDEEERTYTVSFNRLAKLSKAFPDTNSLNSISNIDKEIRAAIGGCNTSAYWAVLHQLWELGSTASISKDQDLPYVFVIDEINRGELSKIFGELFFAIDPGYRGVEGKVDSQYQNLVGSSDVFAKGFYVPENVYIIGTMNDIDRSVESMDFAMRRRFAFKEILASDTMDMIKSNATLAGTFSQIAERMNNLNLCILTIQGFSSAYQIGAAYFLKLANYLEDEKIVDASWDKLWGNHLQGLLFEYLRGMPNAKDELQKLHRAYCLDEKYKLQEGKVVKDE